MYKLATADSAFIAIVSVFIILGIFMPTIEATFSDTTSSNDIDDLKSELGDNAGSSALTAGNILFSIAKMFFWTFGTIPGWLDSIFLIPRMYLLVYGISKLPIVGSG